MKITLSVSGGVSGLSKEKTLGISSLDEKTRSLLMKYFEESKPRSFNSNYNETWSLDDAKEVGIDVQGLPPELKALYEQMKKEVSYRKR